MYIAQRDFTKIEEVLLELFLENQNYSRSFLKKNAVKTICLPRIIPDSFQMGRNRSTSFFEWINWTTEVFLHWQSFHDDLTFFDSIIRTSTISNGFHLSYAVNTKLAEIL